MSAVSAKSSPVFVDRFQTAIKSIKSVLSKRPIVDYADVFIFTGQQVCVWSGMIYAAMPLKVAVKRPIAVNGNGLLRVIKELGDLITSIDFIKGDLVIKAGHQTVKLEGRRADVSEVTRHVEHPSTWRQLHPDFWKALIRIEPLVGRDYSEWKYTNVHLHPEFVEGSDNYQIGRWNMETGLTESMLVPVHAIKPFMRLGLSQVAETPEWLHFRNESNGLTVSFIRWNNEEFPDVTKHFNVEGDRLRLPAEFADSIAKAGRFSTLEVLDEAYGYITVTLRPSSVEVSAGVGKATFRAKHQAYYEGQPRRFEVSPKMMASFVKQFRELEITDDRIEGRDGDYARVAVINASKVCRKSAANAQI